VSDVNVSYADMQSARQLRPGDQAFEGDLSKLRRLVDNLIAGGYVTGVTRGQSGTGATKAMPW
jgi:hypothetical protein